MVDNHNAPIEWNIDDKNQNQRIDYFLKKKTSLIKFSKYLYVASQRSGKAK